MRSAFILIGLLISTASIAGGTFVRIPGGEFRSILKYEDSKGVQQIKTFELMKTPVTNAEFLAFVKSNPQWQLQNIASVFAEKRRYLSHWQSPLLLGNKALPNQPVVHVSWFAASAYCESQNARLPTWLEWEYTAAADSTRRDARKDPAWRESILSWYAKPATTPLSAVGQTPENLYGVQDMHGLIWEWTEDYSAMLVSGDNRTQSDPDKAKFCGAGALSMEDRENYAVMMRVAMLSSLEAVNSTSNLGFRCARDVN
ncbi:MAG: formylglycine-generating enzyme family protein [Arenimonas sp.]|nr:formylglycine-generating enzyme family protein [Arenimonas sp.]